MKVSVGPAIVCLGAGKAGTIQKGGCYGQICAARQKEQERTEKVPRQAAENLGRHQPGDQIGTERQGLQQEKAESG